MTENKKVSKYRDWCLTLFDVENRQKNIDDAKLLILAGTVKYFVEGYEVCPETQKHHIHIYIYYTNAKTFSAMKKDFPKAHIENRMSIEIEDAIQYVKKDETKIFVGDWSEQGVQPVDKRNMVNMWIIILTDIQGGMSLEDVTMKYPMEAIKYCSGIKNMYELHRPKHKFSILEKYGVYNSIQQMIMEYVNGPTHDREIYWVYDPTGGTGKTDLANHLISNNGFLVFGNAKTADVALAWNGENVIFDYSRSQQDHINYGVIEDIKNGRIFSGKYQSCTKLYARPKVLVFANFEPDKSKMSADRWNIQHV